MSTGPIILIILIIPLLGGFSGIGGGPFYGTGYYGGGGLGLIIVILLILVLLGRLLDKTLSTAGRLSSPAKAGDPVLRTASIQNGEAAASWIPRFRGV